MLADYTLYGIYIIFIFDRLSIKQFYSIDWSLCSIKLKTIQEIKFFNSAEILYIRVDSSAMIYILLIVKISTVLSLLS